MTLPASATTAPLAVITGASSGIGRAIAIALAQQGYRTILIARRVDLISALALELSAHQPSIALQMDLLDAHSIHETVTTALREHGPAQVLVNNAGASIYAPMLEQTLEDHRRLMQVHYFAAVQMIHSTLPTMLDRGKGHIINITSMSTKMGPWGHAAYAAAKSAMVSLTQTLAADYQGKGVAFSYVNPGLVLTDFFENPGYRAIADVVKKRGISAEKVAKGVVKLIKRPRLELCIPWHYRLLDWLKALSPTMAHRIVAEQSRPAK